jgi:AraC-like DNA-binding protein
MSLEIKVIIMKSPIYKTIPDYVDPLGEVLHSLKLTGSFYCRCELTAPWGIALPAFEGNMMFHIVTQGHCLLDVEGEKPVLLKTGSLALIPHGQGHNIRSASNATLLPLFDIPVKRISERYEVMTYGGGQESATITCGVVSFNQLTGQQLVSFLPKVLLTDSLAESENTWMQSTLDFIAREAKAMRPGGETVITHLADIVIIQTIRSWLDSASQANDGWLAALRDNYIGRALHTMHSEPEKDWNVVSLAKSVGMSRSGFSARFSQLVGTSAKRYLTDWRLQLAQIQLLENSDPLLMIAERLGYQSEVSFSRAFKRKFGVSPGSVRRTVS